MKFLPGLSLALLAVAFTALPAAAEFTEQDAEEVVVEAFQAMKAGAWDSYAALLHPEDARSFADAFVALAEVDDTGEVREMFFGGLEMDGIRKLSTAEVVARVIHAIEAAMPIMREMLSSAGLEVLGTVREGEQFHVVGRVRMDTMGSDFSKVDVMSARPWEGELRTALGSDLEEIVQQIIESMQ